MANFFSVNNKLPVHTRALFCGEAVKINAGREIISLEFDFIAGEMFGRLGGGSESRTCGIISIVPPEASGLFLFVLMVSVAVSWKGNIGQS